MKTLTESIKPEKLITSMLLYMHLFLHYCDSRYTHSLTYYLSAVICEQATE